MSVVKDLCRQYTDLTDEDIATIEGMSAILKPLANLEDADIFIDCPLWSEDAIVVAEAKPDYVPSSYKKSVVGLLAKKHNEPAVARTFRLGVATKQMKAITQENTHVIQTVEPIRNGAGRVIGVLIREKRADEERVQSERIHFSQQSYKRIANAIAHMTADDSSWLTECIDEALIIVDKDGYVSYCNSLARELYKRLGYVYDILGQSYQNILQIYFPEPRGVDDVAGFSEVEVDAVHDFADIVFGRGDNGTAHAVEQTLCVDVEFRSLAFFSGGRGILIGTLSHNSILSVLINERDFERLVVDVKFQRLVGQFLDSVLNVAGVHGEANVGVAVGHVDGSRQHRFVVAGRDHEARTLYVKHETVEDGHRVFLHNHAADGLKACRKQGAGNGEFHNGN